jgi:hypothetical protein
VLVDWGEGGNSSEENKKNHVFLAKKTMKT